ncbi:hypothetical protein RJG79_08355 [Mycoplasmatota bacterium WC44]
MLLNKKEKIIIEIFAAREFAAVLESSVNILGLGTLRYDTYTQGRTLRDSSIKDIRIADKSIDTIYITNPLIADRFNSVDIEPNEDVNVSLRILEIIHVPNGDYYTLRIEISELEHEIVNIACNINGQKTKLLKDYYTSEIHFDYIPDWEDFVTVMLDDFELKIDEYNFQVLFNNYDVDYDLERKELERSVSSDIYVNQTVNEYGLSIGLKIVVRDNEES